jgi:hypothetical protein
MTNHFNYKLTDSACIFPFNFYWIFNCFYRELFFAFVHNAVVISGISRLFCETRFRWMDRKKEQLTWAWWRENTHTLTFARTLLFVSVLRSLHVACTAGAVQGPCRKQRYNNAYSIGHSRSTLSSLATCYLQQFVTLSAEAFETKVCVDRFNGKAEIERRSSYKLFTDMRRLTTGIRFEKCVVKRFRRCANVC